MKKYKTKQHLNAALAKNFSKWLKKALDVDPTECAYAVHPGGLRLLDNFAKLIEERGVKDGKKECQYSYKNLRLYGNLASAAILFILNDVCTNTDKDKIYFVKSKHILFFFFNFSCLLFFFRFCWNMQKKQKNEKKKRWQWVLVYV